MFLKSFIVKWTVVEITIVPPLIEGHGRDRGTWPIHKVLKTNIFNCGFTSGQERLA